MSTPYTKLTNLEVTGDLKSATQTITGNVAVGGNVAVNTNKFTVAASTGNTAVAGTLGVTGATTLTGALNANGGIVAPSIVKLVELGTITYEATSAEATTLYTLADGDVLLKAYCYVTADFDSGDGDVLILGDSDTADLIFAAADITEGTVGYYASDDLFEIGADTTGTAIKATLTKSGTAATQGSATFYGLIATLA
jgi:hypothetical protein